MGIYVETFISHHRFTIICNALLNSGFHANEPQIVISEKLFRLHFKGHKITVTVVEYMTAGGVIRLEKINGANVQVTTPKKSRIVQDPVSAMSQPC